MYKLSHVIGESVMIFRTDFYNNKKNPAPHGWIKLKQLQN